MRRNDENNMPVSPGEHRETRNPGAPFINASGEVYGLQNPRDFAGEYLDARIGLAATIKGKGDLWVKNSTGVYMHLKTQLEGLALTLGADALTIKMDQ